MTDQELIEKAAKAAGYETRSDGEGGLTLTVRPGVCRPWNPLEDDGDAFRLACYLKMDIMQYDESKDDYSSVSVNYMFNEECYEGSRAAATRRAIVRAAAGCPV